jgi:dihydroflavonol-4-reductase
MQIMTQTVLVTGATGYIAKHLVLQLLNEGHTVVGSARSLGREAELRQALTPHLNNRDTLDRLRIVPLNLLSNDGWEAAMQGVDVVMHTASPVPIAQPKNPEDTIRPAVDGAMRAVRAAHKAGIHRVIMTSSIAAITTSDLRPDQTEYDETNWTDLSRPNVSPYTRSKTMAEQAVWEWQKLTAPEMQITMINPSFVMGQPLDNTVSSSINLVTRLLKGTDPMLPRIGFTCVDVRDIAAMHVRAMERPESIGKRYIGANGFYWFADLAALLRADFPNRKIAKRVAPDILIRALAIFDPAIRSVLGGLGRSETMSSAQAQTDLGIVFRDPAIAVRETAAHLVENDMV